MFGFEESPDSRAQKFLLSSVDFPPDMPTAPSRDSHPKPFCREVTSGPPRNREAGFFLPFQRFVSKHLTVPEDEKILSWWFQRSFCSRSQDTEVMPVSQLRVWFGGSGRKAQRSPLPADRVLERSWKVLEGPGRLSSLVWTAGFSFYFTLISSLSTSCFCFFTLTGFLLFPHSHSFLSFILKGITCTPGSPPPLLVQVSKMMVSSFFVPFIGWEGARRAQGMEE